MKAPLSLRIAVLVLSLLAVFWLPWPVAAGLMFLSGLAFPPAALALGVLEDILYYPGSGLLVGSIAGGALTLLAVLVRYFVKTRIM
jgi:hypothetical protein